jgi:antitoxin component of RelBE/YafQ-DinJ toxin-antitoxin module
MAVLFSCLVEKTLLEQAEKVAKSLGTSTEDVVRGFLAEIARTGRVPVSFGLENDMDLLIAKEGRNQLIRSLDESGAW